MTETPSSVSTRMALRLATPVSMSRRQPVLLAEQVLGRVLAEALELLVGEAENAAPDWLHEWPVVLQDRLELRHHDAPLLYVGRRLGHVQQPVELRVGIAG